MKKIRIAVIDGQGGGIGKAIVAQLKAEQLNAEIMALGTNSTATASMMKAGADLGATGENAIVTQSVKADYIVGVVAILAADSLCGELSSRMAEAIGKSSAVKVLIPLNRCEILVTHTAEVSLSQHIENAALLIRQHIENQN